MKKLFYILSIFIFTFSSQAQNKLTNELIWYSNEFRSEQLKGGVSMSDGEHFTILERTPNGYGIVKYEYKSNNKVEVLLEIGDLFEKGLKSNVSDYVFNKDETKILLVTNKESIYRHSFKADFYVFDFIKKELFSVANHNKGKIQLPQLSPDGKKIAYVRDNNIFISDFKNEFPVTTDGRKNMIINGAVDWVYEEEFGFDRGFNWSPNGDFIAYYKFNESEVKVWDMKIYGELYPDHVKFKYPKAGEKNSTVSIHIYDVKRNNTRVCDLGENKDIYIPRIKWMLDGFSLNVQKLNRLQNKLEFLKFNFENESIKLKGKLIYEESNNSYIEITDNVYFLPNKTQLILTSEKNGFNHLYLIDLPSKKSTQITKGKWDVIDVYGYDEKSNRIYYTSSEEGAINKSLYSVLKSGENKTKLSRKKGYNEAIFSKGFKYYINTYSDANTPPIYTLHDTKGKLIQTIFNNEKLASTFKRYTKSKKEFLTIKNNDGTPLNAWMIKPENFDPKKKYPVLMTVYNGPGRNTVTNSWGYSTMLWHHMLTQLGYIVVSVDGRGTMYRGEQFKKSTYLQLGKLETEDQIAAAKYLASLKYIDDKRIGIQGWSYGGYMSSLCITKGADTFKAAIAVAPVTNWRYYDSIYTERFMRTPQENESGYDDNSPINHVDKLKGNYLLIHGSADDNVHVQNSMEMSTALVNANKQFDYMIYTNKNHGIYGGTTRMHIFNKMTDFLLKNL